MKNKICTIFLIVINIIIWLIVLPIANKRHLIHQYEDTIEEAMKRASDSYNEYIQTGDECHLKSIIMELYVSNLMLIKIEEYEDDEKNSMNIARTISVLKEKKQNIIGVDFLYKGLQELREDLYSDIGYIHLNSFINENME